MAEQNETGKWKGAWLVKCNIGAGESYSRSHEGKGAALQDLRRRIKADWAGAFNIDAALRDGLTVSVWRDGGTSSWDDDEFVETATLY